MKIISLALSIVTFFSSMPVFSLDLKLPVPEKEYFIDSGDIISVNVFPAEEFSKEVTVQPDGTVDIPLIGPVRARGLKSEDLEKTLTAKFSKYVANPSVTINVRKFSSNKVAVIGQINAPGYYEYREGMRLLDLIAQAAGPQDYAKAANVRVYRRVQGPDGKFSEEVVKADLAAVFSGEMDKNMLLLNGDIVYIPRKSYSSAAKWITDNFVPWATLFTFAVTASIVARK
jgi:polysaccharide export outer membrane protein